MSLVRTPVRVIGQLSDSVAIISGNGDTKAVYCDNYDKGIIVVEEKVWASSCSKAELRKTYTKLEVPVSFETCYAMVADHHILSKSLCYIQKGVGTSNCNASFSEGLLCITTTKAVGTYEALTL